MIKTMFEGAYLRQLDNIVQWSEIDVFQRESVSQHSFKVAVFTLALLEDVFGGVSEDAIAYQVLCEFKMRCISYAMLHDFDEALIRRDISHVTKYNGFNGAALRQNLNELADHLAQEEIRTDGLSGKSFYELIMKPDSAVKKFVKLCDWLAMAFFIRRERRMGNQNLKLEDTTVYNGIRNAVEDVRAMLKESMFADFEPRMKPFDDIMNMIYEQRD